MDIRQELSKAWEAYQNEDFIAAISKSQDLMGEVNQEIQGILNLLISNCSLNLSDYDSALEYCKKSAAMGNTDAISHLPQVEAVWEMNQ